MRTMMRRGEHGKGNMGAILALIGFIIFVYAMFKIVPHFMNNYELDDFMKTEARFLSYGQRSEMEARTNIINKARGLDIPTDGLTISKDGRRVKMRLAYTISVEFPGYTFTKDFLIDVDNVGV